MINQIEERKALRAELRKANEALKLLQRAEDRKRGKYLADILRVFFGNTFTEPYKFCMHKLLIASRRKRFDKKFKDLERALYTSTIISDIGLRMLLDSRPKTWRRKILVTLEHAPTFQFQYRLH